MLYFLKAGGGKNANTTPNTTSPNKTSSTKNTTPNASPSSDLEQSPAVRPPASKTIIKVSSPVISFYVLSHNVHVESCVTEYNSP